MLDETVKKEKFIRWCESFGEADVVPLSEDLSKIFMMCFLFERNTDMEKIKKWKEESFLYKVLDKRVEFIKLKATDFAKMFLSCLCKTPGCVVMYLYFFKSVQLGTKRVMDMDFLADLFPYGFPSEDSLKRLWDEQKIDGGQNLLDNISLPEE